MQASSLGLAYARVRPGPAEPPGVEVGLVAGDGAAVRLAYEAALAAGCAPVLPPAEKPWGQTVAYVRDCNGLLVELCSSMDG